MKEVQRVFVACLLFAMFSAVVAADSSYAPSQGQRVGVVETNYPYDPEGPVMNVPTGVILSSAIRGISGPICPPGARPEGEPCGPPDVTNSGCNGNQFLFTPLGCSDTICGQTFVQLSTDQSQIIRDIDWYHTVLTQSQSLSYSMQSSFDSLIFVVYQGGGVNICDTVRLATDTVKAGQTKLRTLTLGPGTFLLKVFPTFSPLKECANGPWEYVLALLDREPPVITCPANISQGNDQSRCGAIVTFTATASDNCSGAAVTCVPPSGSLFPVGTTSVVCAATDAAENRSSCSFSVAVRDTERPTVVCPLNIVQPNDSGQCGAKVNFSASVSDNCGASVTCAPPSGSMFPVGTSIVTCTVTDAAGNQSACSFSVTVKDTEPPRCPADVVKDNDSGKCGAVVNLTASDNCPGVTLSCVPPSGTFFPVGITPVVCTATDAAGNASNCNITVVVRDRELPVTVCPPNITQRTDPGACGAAVSFSTSVSDNCPDATVSCIPPSGSLFPVGTTTVTCTATDVAGNHSTCGFTVKVEDREPPTLTCSSPILQNNDPGQCGAMITFTATGTDNCSGVTVACTPPSGSFFPIGTTSVMCVATDVSGNKDTCMFAVTVRDVEPPRCPADIVQPNDLGQCGAKVSFSASDNCPGVELACDHPPGSFFPVGVTQVMCLATDAVGNQSNCLFSVTVEDREPPAIVCPANVTQATDPGQCGAKVNFPPTTVSNNCPGLVTVSCSPPSGTFFPVGTTTVTCTATDAHGNVRSCQFSVTVRDAEPPVINCPANITVSSGQGPCGATAYFSLSLTDQCPGATVTCTPPSGSFFPVGSTNVTCIATDVGGNRDQCSFTVQVLGPTAAKGDMNADGVLTSADAVLMLNCVFLDASENCNLCVADVNCNGIISPADIVLELNAVFLGISLPC